MRQAYRYVFEAYGGYHFNVNHGLNVDAGIFVFSIGLFSYYNFDNWSYQPSFVSSNTPWFFNGVRVQWFPTSKLKIEPWFVIGWQSYAKYNGHPGLPKTQRIHADDSIEIRYYNNPNNTGLSKMAFSFTADAGCPYGGEMSNWGRYLTLLPPVNGADALSGTPYFTENPGQRAPMWDSIIHVQYMPRQYITWWVEAGYRHSDVPYFAGRGGVTPLGGNNGAPQYFTCTSGATAGTATPAGAQAACGGAGNVWFPDLRRSDFALLARSNSNGRSWLENQRLWHTRHPSSGRPSKTRRALQKLSLTKA